jgi:hypothetical protein
MMCAAGARGKREETGKAVRLQGAKKAGKIDA